jgi:hypothetical protein
MSKVVALPTVYTPPPIERPVPKRVIAEMFGVSTRTVDTWVSRDGMPQLTADDPSGCWRQVGGVRRYYASRVEMWFEDPTVWKTCPYTGRRSRR